MKESDSDIVPRMPRHEAVNSGPLPIDLQINDGHQSYETQLVNVSRSGIRLRIPVALSPDQVITVTVTDSDGLNLNLTAVVRWCTQQEQNAWNIGCELADTVNWETLGELFLRGVLATDPPNG